MEISRKTFALVVLIAVLSTALVTSIATTPFFKRDPRLKANVYVIAETMHGTYQIPTHNLITDIGEAYARDVIGFNNVTSHNNTQWISLCNTLSPLVTWTQLTSEINDANGFARAQGTMAKWANGTDAAYNITKKFTSLATQTIATAGLQWSGVKGSNNNLFAAAQFSTGTVFNANDNCTIKWCVTWDAN